jgi:uncharacterized protein YeeX (DUF496 family)
MEVLKFYKNKCILIDTIKIDNEHSIIISKLKNCLVESFIFNNDDKLWYYKNYKSTIKLYDLLYSNNKNSKFTFINNNYNDYRQKNIIIEPNNKYSNIFPEPENNKILEYGTPYCIQSGRYSDQFRNMYWKVLDNNNDVYYLMHIKDKIYTKISCNDINKILKNISDNKNKEIHEFMETKAKFNASTKLWSLM